MSTERRTKGRNDQRTWSPSQQPPSSEESSGTGSDSTESQREFSTDQFPVPRNSMWRNLRFIHARAITNSRRVDFSTLEKLGLRQDFLSLTARVGFTSRFWRINEPTYTVPTQEFLSSLQLKERDGADYISFQLGSRVYRLWLTDLRDWLGFHPEPEVETTVFPEDMTREQFWLQITGDSAALRSDYKARFISHPLLRVTQRILAFTIFARGETANRANTEDLMMLSTMLRPDGQVRRPDLARMIVLHWLHIQGQQRGGGEITMGAYVTLIGRRLGLQLEEYDEAHGPSSISLQSLQSCLFLRVVRGVTGISTIFWKREGKSEIVLPTDHPISLTDPSTWVIPDDTPPAPAAPVDPSQAADAGPSMSTYQRRGRRTRAAFHHSAGPSQTGPSIPAEPTLHDVYGLLHSMSLVQTEQTGMIRDLQQHVSEHTVDLCQCVTRLDDFGTRLASIEDELRDWRFYDEHGHYPPDSEDP